MCNVRYSLKPRRLKTAVKKTQMTCKLKDLKECIRFGNNKCQTNRQKHFNFMNGREK
jgi:hypothetical protein